MSTLDQEVDAAHRYAGRVALLTLLGAHVEGLDMLIDTLGIYLPENVIAEIESHKLSGARLLRSVQASIVEDPS